MSEAGRILWDDDALVILEQPESPPLPDVPAEPFPRPSGEQMFRGMTREQQDKLLGPEAAELVRQGVPFDSLVKHSPMETEEDWITQRPLSELQDNQS